MTHRPTIEPRLQLYFKGAARGAGWVALGLLVACSPEGAPEADATPSVIEASTAPFAQSSPGVSAQLDESRTTAIVRAASRVAPAVVSVNVISTQPVQPRTMWDQF